MQNAIKKKVLVIYYSQSGQLRRILQTLLTPLGSDPDIAIDYAAIEPIAPYPFPWSLRRFLDVMPESVLDIPVPIKPLALDAHSTYDLIILAYQPWFLSVSIPVTSFLTNQQATLLHDKPVITVTASRNMWLMAHEKIKAHLLRLGAHPVMHIPFIDRAPNWASVISLPAWMLTGNRRLFPWLPRAGVSDSDIESSARFGHIIRDYLYSDAAVHKRCIARDHPAEVIPRLIGCEKAGRRVFGIWARLIRLIGKQGSVIRAPLLFCFLVYLVTVILLVFPLTYITYRLKRRLNPKGLAREVDYYSSGD